MVLTGNKKMLANFVIAFYTEELLTYKNLQNLKYATIYIHNYTQHEIQLVKDNYYTAPFH